MKKLFSLLLALAFVASTGIVGCGGGVDNTTQKVDPKGNRPPENTKEEDDSTDRENPTFANGIGKGVTPPK